jgi:hypothetical protein
MPRLSELTDFDPMGSFTGAQPTAAPAEVPSPLSNNVDKILNSIFRPDEKRLQLWPERLVRAGATAAGEVASGEVPQWAIDPKSGDVHTSPQMVEKAQEVSALAGTGGLGAGGGSLNATPSLRPALKYKDKLYKGKPGQEHMDVIPNSLYPEFQQMAMKGEDISHYNFGFVNDKGHFLSREDALKYGIDNGLIDPQAGKYGALTSTMELNTTPKYVPAVKDNSTNKIYSGDINSTHPSLKYQDDKFLKDTTDGFVDASGNFMTRKEFDKKFGVKGSEDLRQGLTTQLLADSSKPGVAIESLKNFPKSESLSIPPAPTADVMKNLAKIETVNLNNVKSTNKLDWAKFNKGEHPDVLVKGYGDKPIAVKKENGEYLLYDGHHRSVLARNNGSPEMEMYVVNAKDYAPEFAGKKPVKENIDTDALLKELGYDLKPVEGNPFK